MTLAAPASGGGTMTFQAGSDTVVGRATTDTLTNKTIAASTNVLGGVTMTLGSDATGDIYYRSAGTQLTRLAVGGANTVLHGGTTPSYSAVVEGDLGLTDITTANVTSTKHGFAPKSPASASQFLNGAATPAYAAVKDSDLSVSDITTNNVTSTAHGFTPKSPANAAMFLNGAGTPTFASVTDANLSVSDITTNNVSTTAHGFAPKAPNDATKFLNGVGAYSVPVTSSPFTKSFTSADQVITAGGSLTLAHSMGTSPLLIQAALVNQTSELGYTTGQVVFANPHLQTYNTAGRGIAVVPDSTNLNIRYGSDTASFIIINFTTGNAAQITNANWKLRIYAWA
jgi:hypothetical protein